MGRAIEEIAAHGKFGGLAFSRFAKSTFIRDVLSLSGGTAVAQVIMVGVLPILTRLYTPEDFGVLTLYGSVVTLLTVPASLKLEQGVMLPRMDRDAAYILVTIVANSVVWGIALLLVAAIFSHDLARLVGNRALELWLFAVPLSVCLMGWYQGLRFWQMRKRRFSVVGVGAASAAGAGSTVSVGLGWLQVPGIGGAAGLVLGHIASSLANVAVALVGFRDDKSHLRRLSLPAAWSVVKRYRGLAGTLLFSHGIAAGYSAVPSLAIASLYGGTTLGYFGLAERVIGAPSLLIAKALGDVFRQRASVAWREKGRFDSAFKRTVLATTMIAVPLFGTAIAIAPWTFGLFFGEEWYRAGEYARILLVGTMFSFICTPVDKGAIIVGANSYIRWWHLIRLLLYAVLVSAVYFVGGDVVLFLVGLVMVNVSMHLADVAIEYRLSQGIFRNEGNRQ